MTSPKTVALSLLGLFLVPWNLGNPASATPVGDLWIVDALSGDASTHATIGAALAAFARFGSRSVRIVMTQLLAVQLELSAWSSRDYLFISTFERDGTQRSDTQRIADELFGHLIALGGIRFCWWRIQCEQLFESIQCIACFG